MVKRLNSLSLRRVISLFLILVLIVSSCPISAYAQQTHSTVPFLIDGKTYYIDLQSINNELYCRADQWAQAAGCLWKINSEQNNLLFYNDTPVILHNFSKQEYVMDDGVPWVPFFEIATETGVYFSAVEGGRVQGHRAKPLAVFYDDMDRLFGVSKYRITEMILDLGGAWVVASTAARGYAILSSMSIDGFVDAASRKMDRDIYYSVFIEMLQTDESLLDTVTDLGNELTRVGKIVNTLQKALDDGSAFLEILEKMGFSEKEIREIVWNLSRDAYGNKTLNDLSDLYEIDKATKLWKLLGLIDDMTASIEADTHTVMAMQEVFADSDSTQIRYAVEKAIGARASKTLTLGVYTLDYIEELLLDKAIKAFEDIYEKNIGITNLEKLKAEALVWVYDKTLSLTEKSDAIMYSEAHSQLQLEMASYYYNHRDDNTSDNALLMHSVALLYLRSCLAAYKQFEFDKSLAEPLNNAKTAIKAEISNLMTYTEEELLQNGTSKECAEAIKLLEYSRSENTASQDELFNETYWHMSFGQSMGWFYDAKFSKDGTFVARSYGSGEYKNGKYSYNNGYLTIVLDIDGFGYPSTIQFNGGPSEFISLEKYPMQEGEGNYSITRITDSSEFFIEGLTQKNNVNPTPKPTTNTASNASALSDGEYYGLLTAWSTKSMTIELMDYKGRYEQSFNYMLSSTGKNLTLDISKASILLDAAWSDDGNQIKCKTIDSALNTKIWGGGTTVRNNCSMEVRVVVKSSVVTDVVILYAA